MAIPKPKPEDWLKASALELKLGDREALKVLKESYAEVQQILKQLPDTPESALGTMVYRAQLERTRRSLLAEQAKLFDRLGDAVAARRLRAATRAAKLSRAADNALLTLAGAGAEGKRLYDGAQVTAQRTVDIILARAGLSAVPLAEKIYNTSVWMNKRLDRLINQTLARGLNARKFAQVARDWFNPSVKGGTRYAAMRLARTEINNAFHATSVAYAQDKPWVSQMDWNLSGSHVVPDKCNEYAELSPWNVHEIPRKPHPQCMCYVTETPVDEDAWMDRFIAGEFDQYLDGELAAANAQLGIKEEPKQEPQRKAATGSVPVPLKLPKTQAAALAKFQDGMTRDEWQSAGSNLNAIDALIRKKIVARDGGSRTEFAQGQPFQSPTYSRVVPGSITPPTRRLSDTGVKKTVNDFAFGSSGYGSLRLNAVLRGQAEMQDGDRDLLRRMDQVFEQIEPEKRAKTSFRAISGNAELRRELLDIARKRGTFTDQGYTSMSKTREAIDDFLTGDDDVVLVIGTAPGVKILDVDKFLDTEEVGNFSQDELVLNRGTTFHLSHPEKMLDGSWRIIASVYRP